jgi:hypothetical protein
VGIEYTLFFGSPNREAVESELSNLVGASTISSGAIEYRHEAGDSNSMPDATVMIEADSVYFCDHGGSGRVFLGRVVAKLVGSFGAVRIEERE